MAVVIEDYDPTWPRQFEELAAGLRRHLGDGVVSIDHIGSTAVPGLSAKDVIDLQVTMADLAQADRLAPAFERAGYVATPYRHDHRPAGDPSDPGLWEKRLWQSPPGARRVNVHVRVAGWPNQRYALLFRDYLRARPRAAAAYARLKRALAERFGGDLASYTDLKDSACDLIVTAAEDWAAGPPASPATDTEGRSRMTDASARVAPAANFINPEAIHRPFGYTHVVEVTAGRPVYLAGQVALDRTGALVGPGDISAQARQVFDNLRTALQAVGASFDQVVKLNLYLLDITQLPAVREVRDQYVNTARPPASTAVEVRRLAADGLLVEVEAVAVLAEDGGPDR